MKRICVFCGSSQGSRPEYRAAAEELAMELARRNIGLVYGGGNVGLMGMLADAVLRAGGEAVGVIPKHLMEREVGHKGLTKLHVVRSMHERKALMADLSDAFVALPGGFGTLEEFCEAVTWERLGVLHSLAGDVRPCGGGAISEDGEPRARAGAGVGCGVVAGTGTVASGAGGEMAGSGDAVKARCASTPKFVYLCAVLQAEKGNYSR
jgi:uncharacterized protein (TIGR00730 family)